MIHPYKYRSPNESKTHFSQHYIAEESFEYTIRKKKMKGVYLLVAVLALTSSLVSAYDPSPLQDFCVALKEPDGGTKKSLFYLHELYFFLEKLFVDNIFLQT